MTTAVLHLDALHVADQSTDTVLQGVCGARPSWFCEGTWNLTHNRLLSRGVDWFVTRPLLALVVALVAILLIRWGRRAIAGVITRITASRALAASALERIGVDAGASLAARDPRAQLRTDTLVTVAKACFTTLVWAVTALIILGLFNINLGPLLAGVGIAGVAVGLGAQSMVRDCIAGFFMLLEDQCGVGDEVDLGPAIASGTVESVNLRMTQVRGSDGTLWSVPNGVIQRVGNLSRNWSQGLLDITVPISVDIDHVLDVVQQAVTAAAALPSIAPVLLEPPTMLGVERLDLGGVVVRVSVRTQAGKHVAAMRQLRVAVKRALDEQGIPLQPPTV